MEKNVLTQALGKMSNESTIHALLRKEAISFLEKDKGVDKNNIYHEVYFDKFKDGKWDGKYIFDIIGIKKDKVFVIELERKFSSDYTPELINILERYNYKSLNCNLLDSRKDTKFEFCIFIPKTKKVTIGHNQIYEIDINSNSKKITVIEPEEPEFRVKMNELNQVTILKNIRDRFNIKSGDEILLDFKGKILVEEELVLPIEQNSSKQGGK